MTIAGLKDRNKEAILKNEANKRFTRVNESNTSLFGDTRIEGRFNVDHVGDYLEKVTIFLRKFHNVETNEELKKVIEEENSLPNYTNAVQVLDRYKGQDTVDLDIKELLQASFPSATLDKEFSDFKAALREMLLYTPFPFVEGTLSNELKSKYTNLVQVGIIIIIKSYILENADGNVNYRDLTDKLTRHFTRVNILDHREYDAIFAYDNIYYTLGALAIYKKVSSALYNTSSWMNIVSKLFYKGCSLGITLEDYLEQVEAQLEYQDKENARAKEPDARVDNFNVTKEDKRAFLTNYIKDLLNKARADDIEFTTEDLTNMLSESKQEVL